MPTPSLIVFTDEVESSQRDLQVQLKAPGSGQTAATMDMGTIDDAIIRPRIELFTKQVRCLLGLNFKVLKSVGDQLVIAGHGGQDNLVPPLLSLVKAWKECLAEDRLSGSIRVAVYGPQAAHALASGAAVYSRLKTDVSELESAWPYARALEEDFFGVPMNLAARLVGLPKGNAFILADNIFSDVAWAAFARELSQKQPDLVVSARIPLCRLKGFENVYGVGELNMKGDASGNPPLWVREIHHGGPRSPNVQPIIEELKRFHVLRIVSSVVSISDRKGLANPAYNDPERRKRELDKAARRVETILLSPESAGPFYTDALYRIESSWTVAPSPKRRNYSTGMRLLPDKNEGEDQRPEHAEPSDEEKNLQAQGNAQHRAEETHIWITSCPDNSVDEMLSAHLTKGRFEDRVDGRTERLKASVEILAESHSVFGAIAWPTNIKTSAHESIFVLLFQVSARTGRADDFDTFEGLHEMKEIKIISCGLLRGGSDGFLVFATDETALQPASVADWIMRHVEAGSDRRNEPKWFMERILPLRLFHIGPDRGMPDPVVRRAIECESLEKWVADKLSEEGGSNP